MATEVEKQKRREPSKKQEAAGNAENLSEIGRSFLPDTGIRETEEALILQLDLPGVDKGGVSIEVDETNTLRIKAKNSFQEPENNLFREFEIGNYFRSFRLGEEFDKDNMIAKLELGVLEITLPKKEEVKPRRIAIQA